MKYLETAEPHLLLASHLSTAHYIVSGLLGNLLQQKEKQTQLKSPYLPPDFTPSTQITGLPSTQKAIPLSNVSN
jgi:hypothetical protein